MNTPALSLHLLDDTAPSIPLTRVDAAVPAGFPSPADDYLEDRIDLNRELVRNPASTFLARVRGESMRDAGLNDGDLILIDRSLAPRPGSMVLAWVDGGFTVKFFHPHQNGCLLRAANPDFADIRISEDEDARIWGVVSFVIKNENRNSNVQRSTPNVQRPREFQTKNIETGKSL
jgi:DNA polymerase V